MIFYCGNKRMTSNLASDTTTKSALEHDVHSVPLARCLHSLMYEAFKLHPVAWDVVPTMRNPVESRNR